MSTWNKEQSISCLSIPPKSYEVASIIDEMIAAFRTDEKLWINCGETWSWFVYSALPSKWFTKSPRTNMETFLTKFDSTDAHVYPGSKAGFAAPSVVKTAYFDTLVIPSIFLSIARLQSKRKLITACSLGRKITVFLSGPHRFNHVLYPRSGDVPPNKRWFWKNSLLGCQNGIP